MVTVSSLSYRYERDKALFFPDFHVEKGGACLLLGSSGSGKTTLLHLMGALLKIQEGKVLIGDQDISQMSESETDSFRGRNLGFIFQRNHLISSLSVRENLLLAPYLGDTRQDSASVDEVLEQLGLSTKKDARVHELSQGQAQRVAIGRAVLNKPKLILADEPTSALDDENCERVVALLLDISKWHDSTLIIATHDQRLRSVIPFRVQLDNSEEDRHKD